MKYTEIIQANNLISESAEHRTCSQKSKKAGFTLIETIVVATILALIVAFAAGSLASVNRRKATRVGKMIDSELTLLASNTYSREGAWRLEFRYDEDKECYFMSQQYNTSYDIADDKWIVFSQTELSSNVDISFGGDEYDEERSGGTHYIMLSREKGCYMTEGLFEDYFCDNIYIHSLAKTVTINMSAQSGGHRVID